MEGLEIREKLLSNSYENKDFRIDSQFFTQEPYHNPKLKYDSIGNLIKRAQYGISIAMNEEGIGYPIYRMNEIHNMLCDSDVSKSADISKEELETFTLNDRDVVFNRTNSFEWVGRTGLYKKKNSKNYVFASYLVRFIPDENVLLPEYLTAFLNSKYGVQDIKRRARQSINQTNVNPEEVKAIDIPLLSKPFQNHLKSAFDISYISLLKSEQIYKQAEKILLKELGFSNFITEVESYNIKLFSNSFINTGRLDAEYYHPKYDNIEQVLLKNKNIILEKVIVKIDTGEYSPEYFEKEEKEGLTFYIRSTNIKNGQIEFDDNFYVPKENFKRIAKKGDIVTARVGSIGLFGEIRQEMEGAVYSDNVLNFRLPDSYIPSVYTLLFNTKFYFELIDRLARGSVQQRLNQETLKELIIPIISYTKQQEIADLVEESFALKKQSEHLLEVAKRSVEIAIEEGEEVALQYINKHSTTT